MEQQNPQKNQEKKNIPYLLYGSIIALQVNDINQMYITSDGHTKPRVLLHNFDPELKKQQNSKKKSQNEDLTAEPDFSSSLFQIYPKFSDVKKIQIANRIKVTASDNKKREEELQDQQKNQAFKGKESNKGQSLSTESVKDYQKQLFDEYRHNYEAFDKTKGQQVLYFQEIQLLHVNSGKFLACFEIESKYEKENFKVTLSDYSSDATRFKIKPCFKYQSDGEMLIYNGESIQIERAQAFHSKYPFLHASKEKTDEDQFKLAQAMKQFSSKINNQKIQNKYDFSSNNNQGQKQKNPKREVNGSLEEVTFWKMYIFQDYQEFDNPYFQCGDVLWLHHSEANSMLAAERKTKGTDKYHFTSLNLKKWLQKENLAVKVQQISGDQRSDIYQGNSFAMWQILSPQFDKGGNIGFDTQYQLRHLPTGCFLSVAKKEANQNQKKFLRKQDNDELELVLSADSQDPGTLFQFFPLKTSSSIHDSHIKNGSFVFLRNSHYKKWIDVISLFGAGNAYLKNIPKQAVLKQDLSENQVFKLFRAGKRDKWETIFVNSSFNLLVKFCLQLMDNPTNLEISDDLILKKLREKVAKAAVCVAQLIQFVQNQYGSDNTESVYGNIEQSKQNLLREQYFIDILVKILEEMLRKPELEIYKNRVELLENYEIEKREFKKNSQEEQSQQRQNFLGDQAGQNQIIGQMLQEQENEPLSEFSQRANMVARKQKIDMKEYIYYIKKKVQIAISIYQLLGNLCNNNRVNQIYCFELIPFFQIHTKYIPEAIECIISIVKNNQIILNRLAQDLKIEYDHKKSQKGDEEQKRMVKFLINLYDNDLDAENEEKIEFRQHEKISTKSINLVQYFMNLIWDEQAELHSHYLKFLGITCILHNKGVTLNQENIYKLYKKYSSVRSVIKFDSYFMSGDLILPKYDLSAAEKRKFENDVSSQLLFVSQMAYDRNFLWKKELTPHFSRHYLLKNIWNNRVLQKYPDLRSSFIKMSMSLYIDHDPLKKRVVPDLCRLYQNIDKIDDVKIFQSQNNKEDENEMYQDLSAQMLKYLYKIYNKIDSEIKNYTSNIEDENIDKQIQMLKAAKGKDLLNQKLLINTIELLQMCLEVNLFESIDKVQYYPFFVQYLLRIFQYDNKKMNYVSANILSEKYNYEKQLEKREQEVDFLKKGFAGIGGIMNIMKKTQIEPDIDEDQIEEQGNQSDNYLRNHLIMRGYMGLHNQLENVIYEDPKLSEIEIELKLKICEILNHFLDLRQDFLVSNFLYWFKNDIIKKGKKFTSPADFQATIDEEFLYMLPNISKTGFESIDETYKPKELISQKKKKKKLNLNLINQEKQKIGFQNSLKDLKGTIENFDLDAYLQLAFNTQPRDKKEKEKEKEREMNLNQNQNQNKDKDKIKKKEDRKKNKKKMKENQINLEAFENVEEFFALKGDKFVNEPITSALPSLLSSFLLIQDQKLETKCMELMMRIFNQREEFITNIYKIQILFDYEKEELYLFLKEHLQELKKHIEQTEVWLSTYIKESNDQISRNYQQQEQEGNQIIRVLEILDTLDKSFYENTVQYVDEYSMKPKLEIQGTLEEQVISTSKQRINKYLNGFHPVIELIIEGMNHFDMCILDERLESEKKEKIINLFKLCYSYLTKFAQGNEENQMILFQHMHIFTAYLKYDLGQIQLITEIYRDNVKLLKNHVNQQFIDQFIDLIDNEGRQEHILILLTVIQKLKNKYIFDNQLLILNSFLPLNQVTDKNVKLLYCDGSIGNEFKFFLYDSPILQPMNLLQKLEEVNFRDTYCDQPFLYHFKLIKLLLECCFSQNLHKKQFQEMLSGKLDQQLNISVAKLKKTFKLSYLFTLLMEDDFFQNEDQQYNSLGRQASSRSNYSGSKMRQINQDSFSKSPSKQLSSPKKSGNLSKNQSQYKQNTSEEIKKKQGFSLLKPVLVDYIRYIYIQAQRPTAQSDIVLQEQDMTNFLEKETQRFKYMQKESVSKEYLEYLFDSLLPMIIYYKKQFINNYAVINMHSGGDKKHRKILEKFAKEFKDKVQQGYFTKQDDADETEKFKNFSERAQSFFQTLDFQDEGEINYDQYFGLEILRNQKSSQLIISEQESKNQSPSKLNKFQKILSQNKFGSEKEDSLFQDGQEKQKQKQKSKQNLLFSGKLSDTKKTKKNKQKQQQQLNINSEEFSSDQMESVEQIWNLFVENVKENKQVKDYIDQEQNALAEAIINVKKLIIQDKVQISDKEMQQYQLNVLLQKFIIWMQNSVDESENLETIQTLLNTFKNILSNGKDTVNIQNMFNRLGGMRMILSILSDKNSILNSDLLINLLEFANMMLKGGNNEVQKTIFEFLSTSNQSEYLFYKFNSIIRRQIDYIDEYSKMKQYEKTIIDAKDEQSHEEDIEILNQVLNFLQNCVEGHYLDLQNYFREQTNSRNNYNMINAVADLLRTYYYQARQQKMYQNMIQCLETLSEFVQGPCLENQIAVSESKFFDICKDFIDPKDENDYNSLKSSVIRQSQSSAINNLIQKNKVLMAFQNSNNPQQKQKQGDQPLTEWMNARLQNKCLILVLSLLEMRDVKNDNQIMERIIRNLLPQNIERNMAQVFQKFTNIYGKNSYPMAALEHLERDPQSLTAKEKKNLPKNYFDTIIQNGFYMFFLLRYYLESEDDSMQNTQILSLMKSHEKKKTKPPPTGLEKLLLGDTLVAQLLQLFLSVMKVFLDSSKYIKQKTLDKILEQSPDKMTQEQKLHLQREKQEKEKKLLKQAFKFFAQYSAKIELVRNDQIEIVFFILLPYCESLPKEKKQQFQDNVDRSNNKQKVQDLVDESGKFIQICKHEYWLKTSKNKILTFFGNHVKLWKNLSFFLVCVLNLFIFASFASSQDRSRHDRLYDDYSFFRLDDFDEKRTKRIFQILGIAMTVFSFFVLIFYLLKNVPLLVQDVWNDQDSEKSKKKGFFKTFMGGFFKCIKVLIKFFQAFDILFYIAYGVLALFGVLIHPFFFTFHLTEVMMRYPSLKNVLKSVYQPRRQLILTFVLFIVIEYFFTVIAYIFLYEDYQHTCDSMLYCFLFIFDQTFKANSGVGAVLTGINGQVNVAKDSIGRFFFDNLFFYILVLIMVEIVAGIIIDTFSQLREDTNDKMEDIKDKCFICGHLKTTFDRQSVSGAGFIHHIKINHYMWNYMFFIAYLEWKNHDDYTGIESFVSKKMEENDTSWFPFNRAKELQDQEELSETKQDILKMEDLRREIQSLRDNIKDIDKTVSNANKKIK